MDDLLLHPKTLTQLKSVVAGQPHGILLSGTVGSGKETLSRQIAANLLGVGAHDLDKHPYLHIINPEGESISIDEIRALQQFLKLRVPGQTKGIQRIVIISRADRMRAEAQNALLKTLEEPPIDTSIILTTAHAEHLLPTITSRVISLPILPVSESQALEYFAAKGKKPVEIARSYALSQGQAGLLHALMNEEEHSLLTFVETAKQILAEPAGKRLLRTDILAKNKQDVGLLLNALQRIAHAAITNAGKQHKQQAVKQWSARYEVILQTVSAIKHNPNQKLLLDNLFLNM